MESRDEVYVVGGGAVRRQCELAQDHVGFAQTTQHRVQGTE